MTIENCGASAIILEKSTLTLNNVNFINNNDPTSGAAIYLYDSQVTTYKCLFENNAAPEGSAIYVEKSNSTLNRPHLQTKILQNGH